MPKPAIIPLLSTIPLSPLPDYPAEEMASGSRSSQAWFAMGDAGPGLTVGLWAAEANETNWLDYPLHNFMLVLEGELAIITDTEEVIARAGESVFVPQGLRCRYAQPGYSKLVVVGFLNPAEPKPSSPLRVIKIDPQVTLSQSAPPAASMQLSPVPIQHTHDYFSDSTGQFTVGVWETTGYHRKLIDFPRHELMHLLEGSVTFTDDVGQSQIFKAGDTFFVPLGTPNAWKSEGHLRKIYCIFQPNKS